ncbi:MAG: restriction endonuclease subunit S, partial [Fusobacteriaceae bacterium]
SDKMSNEYLYYVLSEERFFDYTVNTSKGTKMPRGDKSAIMQYDFDLPSLETQEKIASILSALDDKIEINNEMNKTLEEMAQTLFKRWFIDFDLPNENGEPYKTSGGKMIDSELGEIPEGWRIGALEEVIDKIIDNRGKTPPRKESGIPLIEGHNIFLTETNPILNSKQKYVSEETYNSWFRAGHPEYLDILCATVGTLPKWCFVANNMKVCIAQNIIGIRSNNLISPYYLKMYIDTENFIKRFEGRIITTAQPSIKVGHLISLLIIIPKKKIIDDFDIIIKNLIKKKENNQQEIQSLTEIRNTLLPKLMSGEIEV